jgi:hypothetical protein
MSSDLGFRPSAPRYAALLHRWAAVYRSEGQEGKAGGHKLSDNFELSDIYDRPKPAAFVSRSFKKNCHDKLKNRTAQPRGKSHVG